LGDAEKRRKTRKETRVQKTGKSPKIDREGIRTRSNGKKITNGAQEYPEKHLFHVFGEMRPWPWWIMGIMATLRRTALLAKHSLVGPLSSIRSSLARGRGLKQTISADYVFQQTTNYPSA
jgi:hypothetical protein